MNNSYSVETTTTLRKLARDYAVGILSKDMYRRKRAILLDELTGDLTTDQGATDENLITRPRKRIKRHDFPSSNALMQLIKAHWKLALTGLCIIAVCVGLLISFFGSRSQQPIPDPSGETQAVQYLLESFVLLDVWNTQSIVAFVETWDQLPEQSRKRARDTIWFKRLEQRLRERILEQRALNAFNDSNSKSTQQLLLVAFGEHMGIKLP